jgi:ribosomal protein S18 acetylase RimI-like enzyme
MQCSIGESFSQREDSMRINVIRADGTHLDLLTALFDGYRQFYRQTSDPSRARTFIAERLQHADSVIFLAFLETNGPQVACGFTQLYPSFSSVRTQRIWILNDLFVEPTQRMRGVGHALIEAAHRHAAETGAGSVTLSTEHTNETAKALYRESGYKRVTTFEQYTFHINEPVRV